MRNLYIVFDGAPHGPQHPRFVEVEDEDRSSVRAGEWTHEFAPYWRLGPFQEPDTALAQSHSALLAALDRLIEGSLEDTDDPERLRCKWCCMEVSPTEHLDGCLIEERVAQFTSTKGCDDPPVVYSSRYFYLPSDAVTTYV